MNSDVNLLKNLQISTTLKDSIFCPYLYSTTMPSFDTPERIKEATVLQLFA